MYNLLIADDECMIADLLGEFMQNHLEGEVEVFTAYSGNRARAIIDKTTIHILLTDINMPGLNGLDLHKIAMEANSRCKVIFLTGFQDIKKVQYALRHESVDFILKTEGNEVILNSVRRAVAALENELNAERLLHKTQEQLRLTMPILHERIVLDLLDGEVFDRASFEEIEFPLDINEKVLLLLGHVDNDYAIPRNIRYRLKNLSDNILGSERRVLSVVEGTDILWLLQPVEGNGADKARQAVQSCMDDVQKICMRAFQVSISLALAQGFVSIEEILPTWLALKQTLKNLHGLGDGMLLIESNAGQSHTDNQAGWLYVRKILQNIQMSVDNLQYKQYKQHYEKLSAMLRKKESISDAHKTEALLRLYLVFLSNDAGEARNSGITELLSTDGDWDSYDSLFSSLAEDYFSRQSRYGYLNANHILGKIKQYIDENLGGDLSLDSLARIANFSPSYLSRLFKQVTNCSLSDYIGQQKCKRAKAMLREDGVKIAEVAMTLGFDTSSYFTRFFKKYTGMSPLEFRKAEMTKKDKK